MPEEVGLLSVLPTAMLVFGGIVVVILVAVFATVTVRGVGQWRRNNASPVVTAMARVVTKARRGEWRHRGEPCADRIFRDV